MFLHRRANQRGVINIPWESGSGRYYVDVDYPFHRILNRRLRNILVGARHGDALLSVDVREKIQLYRMGHLLTSSLFKGGKIKGGKNSGLNVLLDFCPYRDKRCLRQSALQNVNAVREVFHA
jgi:hypothetical protein